MLAGKNTGAPAFGGLTLQALPQTSPMLGNQDQRTGLINTTFILVGAPTGGDPGHAPWTP